jgi:hypothetical protein
MNASEEAAFVVNLAMVLVSLGRKSEWFDNKFLSEHQFNMNVVLGKTNVNPTARGGR